MIRITVEMLPHGSESDRYELATMEIANEGTGTAHSGNYTARLSAEYGNRTGRLWDFKRKNQSVWSLIGAFLKLWGHTRHSPSKMDKHWKPEPGRKRTPPSDLIDGLA